MICYSKATSDLSDIVIVLCNLDPFHKQIRLDRPWISPRFGLDARRTFQAHDLLSDGPFSMAGAEELFRTGRRKACLRTS